MTEQPFLNLLTDDWLPVRLLDGGEDKIALNEIARADVIDIVAPRADFRGAIYQLLIGLLQTAFAPEDIKTWRQYWRSPPDADVLEQAFLPYRKAFVLDAPVGEPAFMQDLTLEQTELEPIEALFFGGPGKNTTKNNEDHFIKRNAISAISPYWTAIALFTYQINTAGGGSGHRVTLRGGGPLTTLLLPKESDETPCLWVKLWMNILTRDQFSEIHGNHELTEIGDIFPWMRAARTSEKDEKTLPLDVNPLQMYWPMPARIRILWKQKKTTCDITGDSVDHCTTHMWKKNKGVNYEGNWTHPLTPYNFSKKNLPISFKGRDIKEGYKNWTQLVMEGKTSDKHTSPALVVSWCYRSKLRWFGEQDEPLRLWSFGYDLASAKAKCWYETVLPVFSLSAEQSADLVDHAKKMSDAAASALDNLKKSLKIALFRDPKNDQNAKKFLSKTPDIDANFWTATEPTFYNLLSEIVSNLDDDDAIDERLQRWGQELKQQARILFDQYALSSLNEDGDLMRVVKARDGKGGLNHYLNGSKAMKALAA